jgi:hypothetical protein
MPCSKWYKEFQFPLKEVVFEKIGFRGDLIAQDRKDILPILELQVNEVISYYNVEKMETFLPPPKITRNIIYYHHWDNIEEELALWLQEIEERLNEFKLICPCVFVKQYRHYVWDSDKKLVTGYRLETNDR